MSHGHCRPSPLRQPGCLALVPKGRNPDHTAENTRRIDRYRNSRHDRGYGVDWERTRERILERDFQLCRVCRTRTATEVDHVGPKESAGSDEDHNLQSICSICRDIKTAVENAQRDRSHGGSAHA